MEDKKFTIQEASFSDYSFVKELMIKALKDDPLAFSVDYEEYAFNSEEWWRSYLTGFLYRINSVLFLAKSKGTVVGMIGIIFEKKNRRTHLCSLVWFYVDKEYRALGIGKLLMNRALNEINSKKTVIKISLIMNTPQLVALNIYTSFGFKIVGTLKKEMKINNEFIDEYILEKILI